jgi:hypothetical protein
MSNGRKKEGERRSFIFQRDKSMNFFLKIFKVISEGYWFLNQEACVKI